MRYTNEIGRDIAMMRRAGSTWVKIQKKHRCSYEQARWWMRRAYRDNYDRIGGDGYDFILGLSEDYNLLDMVLSDLRVIVYGWEAAIKHKIHKDILRGKIK